ncbi:DUF2147 domain-containing protein [Devosia elaeis]|jgi:Uncharacterized protein conserved in bacteria (DUF2147).|uniref:DUF2147 domain-containing protein n=1 Tax=Devosia elaeis TaxID=1770058 RepID=UPI000AB2BB5C|nr:DUF2147 domain-containing protein [Devosia elaeis]
MLAKSLVAATAIALSLAVPTIAQDASPNGTWVDRWGTSFTFELCGDGTQLCGVLNDIQGDSRTEENLKFVNQEVVRGTQTGPNKWEGNIALNGGNAKATVELTGPDTLKITGCRAVILCSSIDYHRQ